MPTRMRNLRVSFFCMCLIEIGVAIIFVMDV